jgi:hypothetical protein
MADILRNPFLLATPGLEGFDVSREKEILIS